MNKKIVKEKISTTHEKGKKSIVKALEEVQELFGKQRITIYISKDLIERIKNAVYWEPGLTMASFAEGAFIDALKKVEKLNGGPYPTRKQKNLKPGRRIK